MRNGVLLLLLLLLLASCAGGCVRRRLTVRTDPPGALVSIDGQEIGTSPVATSFTYYGTRQFRVAKDGYETVNVQQNFQPPWYQFPIIEFFSENLWPGELRDERAVNFDLTPQRIVSAPEVLERADGLRKSQGQSPESPSSRLPNVAEAVVPDEGRVWNGP